MLTAVALTGWWAVPVAGQTISTVAGTGSGAFSGDGGPAADAALSGPVGVHGRPTGVLYVADAGNHRIRRVAAAFDTISTVAGTGTAGFSGDGGAATSAQLSSPTDVFVDSTGNLYVADTGNHRVRRITTAGVISTVAGTGTAGFSGDGGAATSAKLNSPSGVYVTNGGILYIADRGNHRVRRVTAGGVISTVAGTGTAGFSGDGAAAASARLNGPADVYRNAAGVLYIADTDNHRIRAVAADSTISTVAGSVAAGFSGDGSLATSARLAFPSAVFVDTVGNLYIADRFNHRLRRVNTTGNITTLAGDGTLGSSGDGGAANRARLGSPGGVWLRDDREIFVGDSGNHRLRRIDDDNVVGLASATAIGKGREVQILGVSFTGDGSTAVKGVRLTVSDLTVPTGLSRGDFVEFRLYASADSVVSPSSDTLLGSVAATEVTLGTAFAIQTNPSPVPGAGQKRHYVASAAIAAGAVDGHAFKVDFPTGGLSTSIGGHAVRAPAADARAVTIDVVATRLRFATQPDGVISGNPLVRQPVVTAADDLGYVDDDFGDTVTLSLGLGAGTLLQATAAATAGVATFTSLTYLAAEDQETFILVADDQAGGAEGDLPAVASNTLTANTVNDPPTVVALSFNLDEDGSVTVPVTSMVGDVDDSLSSLQITFTASHTAVVVSGSQMTIQPDPDFFGLDTLLIVATDPFGGIGSDLSLLTIRPINDVPEFAPLGRRLVDEDDTLVADLRVQVRDRETPFADLTWSFVPSAGLSTSFTRATGLLTAWVAPEASGTHTLTMAVSDAELATTTVRDTIVFLAVNDPPVLHLPRGIAIARDSTLVLSLTSFVTDVDHAKSSLTWSAANATGLSASLSGALLTVRPVGGFGGTGRVAVTVTDPAGGTGGDTLFVAVPSPPPQAPLLASLPALAAELGDTLRLDLAPYVTDADHDDTALSWTVSTPPAGSARVLDGVLLIATAGATPYTAILSVRATDPDGLSSTASLTVRATAILPLLLPFPDSLVVDLAGTQLLLDGYVRSGSSPAAVTWSADATGELDVVIDPQTRIVTIDPRDGSRAGGRVAFSAVAGRKSGGDTVVVVVTNLPPTADLPDFFLDAGESAQLLLDDFATDDDDVSLLTWSAAPLEPGLSVSLSQAVRVVTLTAAAQAAGTLRVAFTATDRQGAAGRDTMRVTVRGLLDTTSAGGDTIQVDTSQVDTSQVDTTQVDTSQVDTSQVDTTRVDTSRVDTSQVEASPVDTSRVDTTQTDTTRTDTSQVDTSAGNTAPTVGPFNAVTVNAGASTAVSLDGYAVDDGPDQALTWSAQPEAGVTAVVDAATRVLTLFGDPGFSGTTAVRVTATDAAGERGSGTLVVHVRPPVVVADPGDFSGDDRIEYDDFFLLIDHLGRSVLQADWDPAYDLNGDGRTNFDDFFLFIDLFESSRLAP